jgi:hypothetical protein
MARHVMTAARKAALRKAQLASARKRRRGISRKSQAARVRNRQNKKIAAAAEKSHRYTYAGRHYKGPGGIYKMNVDRYHSRGAFSRSPANKPWSKGQKRVNKVAQGVLMANPGASGLVAASYIRGRRAGTIKKKKR